MSGEGPPELTAALQLIDLATARGFSFTLATSGEELPVWGERETPEYRDVIFLGGLTGNCNAARGRRASLLVPGELVIAARVSGDALTVLHTACHHWPIEEEWLG